MYKRYNILYSTSDTDYNKNIETYYGSETLSSAQAKFAYLVASIQAQSGTKKGAYAVLLIENTMDFEKGTVESKLLQHWKTDLPKVLRLNERPADAAKVKPSPKRVVINAPAPAGFWGTNAALHHAAAVGNGGSFIQAAQAQVAPDPWPTQLFEHDPNIDPVQGAF